MNAADGRRLLIEQLKREIGRMEAKGKNPEKVSPLYRRLRKLEMEQRNGNK